MRSGKYWNLWRKLVGKLKNQPKTYFGEDLAGTFQIQMGISGKWLTQITGNLMMMVAW